jgi:hypothetical protein
MKRPRPVTTPREGSSATSSAAATHQEPRTTQERRPPATLRTGRRAEAASTKRPAFRMASRRASPKSAPGATG